MASIGEVCSHTNALPSLDYLETAPATPPKERREGAARPRAPTTLTPVQRLPLGAELARWRHSSSSGDVPVVEELLAEEVVELEEDEVEAVFAALEAKRQEWRVEERVEAEDFGVQIRGGPWTLALLGVPFDSVQGRALGSTAKDWCRK